jgi:hypothetical protein
MNEKELREQIAKEIENIDVSGNAQLNGLGMKIIAARIARGEQFMDKCKNECSFILQITPTNDAVEVCTVCHNSYFHKAEDIEHLDLRKNKE